MSVNTINIFENTREVRFAFAMEGRKFSKNGVTWLTGWVWEDAAACQHDKGEAAEAFGDLDADPTGVLILLLPAFCPGLVMVIVADQVVGDAHQDATQPTIATAAQGSVGVDLIGLVARGAQACAAGNVVGVGIVLDRSQLAGEFGRTDDGDARP